MKNELRRFYKILRQKIKSDDKKKWDNIIRRKVLESPYYRDANSIFTYFSKNDEIDTKEIIKKSLSDKKKVYIPKILEDYKMVPVLLESFDDLVWEKFGTKSSKNKKTCENPDLTIVPGLAFDENLYRLGFGGGFYDRYIKDHKDTIYMGLFYDNSKSFKLNIDDFDQSLNIILTEKKIYKNPS